MTIREYSKKKRLLLLELVVALSAGVVFFIWLAGPNPARWVRFLWLLGIVLLWAFIAEHVVECSKCQSSVWSVVTIRALIKHSPEVTCCPYCGTSLESGVAA